MSDIEKLREYCRVNDMGLSISPYGDRRVALVRYEGESDGDVNRPCRRLSGYLRPKELLIWIDGYHAGKQNL